MAIALELLPRVLAGIGEREMTELDEHLDVQGRRRSCAGSARSG
jgi:hypothetical protein